MRSSRSRRPQELPPHSSPLPRHPNISEDLIHYVSVFVPDHSGDHYVPHVSIGVGTIDFLTTLAPHRSTTLPSRPRQHPFITWGNTAPR